MTNLQERAIKAAERFVERRGMEVMNAEWKSEDGGAIDLVALEDEAVVFIDVNARSGADKGMPEENIPAVRERMETNAAKWLAENADDERFVNVRSCDTDARDTSRPGCSRTSQTGHGCNPCMRERDSRPPSRSTPVISLERTCGKK